MAIFAVGDVQGCCAELRKLIDELPFDPSNDELWFVGDLVNRGPDGLGVLRFVRELGPAARTLLGNHDLHLLALALGKAVPVADDDLAPVLAAADGPELVDWLRRQPLAHHDPDLNTLMVHAGIIPSWNGAETLARAREVEAVLHSDDCGDFLTAMYGSRPDRWAETLEGQDRLRFITNCLTRIRFVRADESLDFDQKGPPGSQPPGLVPWFEMPGRATSDLRIVFGHWSTLGLLQRPNLIGLDTGVVWGGKLTAVRLDAPGGPYQVTSSVNRRNTNA
jgi:bis(5'-nucleosyl)-tetraphosphatase (symmetrical)